jgi:type II secretion system protein C
MNISFNPALIRVVRNLLVIILVAKVISLLMLWYFPSEGVNYHPSSSKMPEYRRYSVQNIIRPAQKPDSRSTEEGGRAYGPNISDMLLTGLYKKRKNGGFIIIAPKAKPDEADVIGIGESFQGYTLKTILDNGAVFTKDGKSYSLFFSEEEPKEYYAQKTGTVPSEEGIKQVEKSDIAYYAENVEQIWKDISIIEVKKDDKITGFKVTRIKPGTPFASLGLRQGDIIIKANNKPMTSYKDALEIYKGIDKLEALELIVLRDNQETEIVYEIN